MFNIFRIAVVAILLFSCHSTKQSSSGTTQGWKTLFDGKTTTGWHKYGGGAIDSVWKVKDGILTLDTLVKKQYHIQGDWDIVTDDEYENFDLQVEWKISKNGNSGIMFYIYEDKARYDKPWNSGMEMQVLDNNGHPDGKFPKHRAGDLYDLISCSKETVKPPGEWNLAEIKSLNGKLDFYLNGVNVVSTTLWDDQWKKLVAGSKFKDMAGFGTFKKGRIGLQDHGNGVSYRNIKIRKL